MTTSEEGFVPERDGAENGRTPLAGRKMKDFLHREGWEGNWREGVAGSRWEVGNWGGVWAWPAGIWVRNFLCFTDITCRELKKWGLRVPGQGGEEREEGEERTACPSGWPSGGSALLFSSLNI